MHELNSLAQLKEKCFANAILSTVKVNLSLLGTSFIQNHHLSYADRRPAYFPALARLVEVMRRTGTLDEAGPYLDRAEQATLRPNTDPGYNFCRGLYEW